MAEQQTTETQRARERLAILEQRDQTLSNIAELEQKLEAERGSLKRLQDALSEVDSAARSRTTADQ